jgi:hypothetical protein
VSLILNLILKLHLVEIQNIRNVNWNQYKLKQMKPAPSLKQLDEHKAIGPYGLPTIILKKCAEAIAPSITAFINYGLHRSLYLTDWKYANIPPPPHI